MYNSLDENLNWYQAYVDQSVTFNSWRKVELKVSQILKQKTEKRLMDPISRQIIFQMLGQDFVIKYFSSYTNNPSILANANIEEKKKKEKELRIFMSSIVNEIFQTNEFKNDSKVLSDISYFSKDLENLIEDSNFSDQRAEKKHRKKTIPDLHEKYLSILLSTNDTEFEYVMGGLRNNYAILTDNLRRIIWPACTALKEKSKNIRNADKIKEKFKQMYIKYQRKEDVDRNMVSITEKIYKDTKYLSVLESEANIKSTVTILRMCNVTEKNFQHSFIYLAIIIQQIYTTDRKKNSDECYANAAFLLEKLIRLCPLSEDKIDKITSVICKKLIDLDKSFELYIKKILSSNSKNEKVTSDKITESNSSKLDYIEKEDEIFFYIKKWISSMFTTVFKQHTFLFIWDQLFLNRFENKIFQDVTLSLLGLLKPWFLQAKDKEDIRKVFLEEPSALYLLDIRRALSHVQNKRDFQNVPQMNRNLTYGYSKSIPAPSPKTVPLERPKTPKFVPKFTPWIPFNKDKKKELNSIKGRVDIPFDLYIDSIRFLPDNATIIKVTGKIINIYLTQKSKSIKFQIFPEPDSFWRYPRFKFKQVINSEKQPMNPDMVIMIRVYTIEQHSKSIFVLGSCLFSPFSNKHGKDIKLRVGGHQVRIRYGIPDPDFNVENMLASHMDNNPVIPGVTILLRVLPHQSEFISAPQYETSFYRTELARPTESENKIYDHYKNSENLSLTIKDATVLITEQITNSDAAVKQLLQKQLQKEGSEVEDFPYQRYINYCKTRGMMILIDKAAGLPIFLEGRYLQCLVQICPGEDTKFGDGKLQTINFVTKNLELESPQRSPDWSDQPQRVHPEYDDHAFILISLYGLRPRYDPATGKLLDKDKREPKFNLHQAIAWSAIPCFEKGAVFAGIHHAPLLKGRPSDEIIEKLSYLPLNFICKEFKSQVKVFETAGIEISIWDGHFNNSECAPLPVHNNLLNISKNPSKYLAAFELLTGATVADLFKLALPDSSEFNKYKSKIKELLNETIKNNLDNYLIKSGYKATI